MDAKDEALRLSKAIMEMQPQLAEIDAKKDEIQQLNEQIQRMESQLKEAELDSVFLTSENDNNKKVDSSSFHGCVCISVLICVYEYKYLCISTYFNLCSYFTTASHRH